MRTTTLLLLLLAACSGSTPPDGGTAGGSAGGAAGGRAGGAGGSGGGAQAGGGGGGAPDAGAGGGGPVCRSPVDLIETCVVAPDGGFATDDFTASLAVTEVTEVAGGLCDSLDFSVSTGTAKRIVLDGGWQVIFRAPQTPAAFINPGETLELALSTAYLGGFPPTISQTFALSRGADPIAFGAVRSSSRLAEVPDFSAQGITVADAGTFCVSVAMGCRFQDHHLLVSAGGESALLMPRGTVTVGPYAVTLEDIHDAIDFGMCDQKAHVAMAGVRLP